MNMRHAITTNDGICTAYTQFGTTGKIPGTMAADFYDIHPGKIVKALFSPNKDWH